MNNKQKNIKNKPALLLHTCCAPCFTSVFEQLKDNYDVTILWFNPNIYPKEEHEKRLDELRKYAKKISVNMIVNQKYEEEFASIEKLISGYAEEPEGAKRCEICIKYRLLNTADIASKNDFDYFTTTLSVSPYKNTKMINEIGFNISKKVGIKFLDFDFKKNNGYKRSVEICKEFNIYRQKYCGCQYSKNI